MAKYLIVVPVFNEASVIEDVTFRTLDVIKKSKAELLFINDGSSDGSKEVLDSLKSTSNKIHTIHKTKNEGYGASLITGFDYAIYEDYDYVITMDCDAQHEPKDLIRFMNAPEDIDILSGSRYLPNSITHGNPPNDRVQINQKITNKLNKKFGLNLTDSFCGFKRYKIETLYGHEFEENGYAFPLEFWVYAVAKKFNIQEIAVDRIYITDDRSFGEDLDKKRKRYRYYLEVLRLSELKYSEVEI